MGRTWVSGEPGWDSLEPAQRPVPGGPAQVAHHLYFPDEADARRAATVLGGKGLQVEVRQIEGSWHCHAQEMVPSVSNVEARMLLLRTLADALGGEYDGWDAGPQGRRWAART